VQDTFLVLAVNLPHFDYDPRGRFRGWLWTVFLNCCRQTKRRPDLLGGAAQTEMDLVVGGDCGYWYACDPAVGDRRRLVTWLLLRSGRLPREPVR
jgi:hypothetical protein